MTDPVVIEAISAQAMSWGRALVPGQAESIARFFEVLLQWNARVNLTGARSVAELVGDHLPDSFALARLAPESSTVVDVGSGGGLPAVPFAVLRPDCPTLLVEPRAKRCAFLATAKRILGSAAVLDVERCRHDELPRGPFVVAASRATFPPEEWIAVGHSLVGVGGRVVVFAATEVTLPSVGCDIADAVQYVTAGGARRWAGAFVPRGTVPSAG